MTSCKDYPSQRQTKPRQSPFYTPHFCFPKPHLMTPSALSPPGWDLSLHTCSQRNCDHGDMWHQKCHFPSALEVNTKPKCETGQLSKRSEPLKYHASHTHCKSIMPHNGPSELTMLSHSLVSSILTYITKYRRPASLSSGILSKRFYLD